MTQCYVISLAVVMASPGLFITGMIGVASCGSDEFLGSPWLANPVNCRPATEQGER
jgi:hypothetical protein